MLAETRSNPVEARVMAKASPHADAGPAPLLRPGVYLAVKRGCDFLLALVLFIPALPVMFLAVLLVKLTSRGPAFYSQIRLGLHGRPFRIHKIRTMAPDSEKNGACWSMPGDTRVTRAGRFLRKTHLDELPQLWNVLRGDMSLVGPRPERPEFVPSLEQAVPRYRDRLLIRPGLTGLAQVQLPPDSDLESVRRKVAYDLFYISRMSLWLDLRLMAATACYLVGQTCVWACRVLRIPGNAAAEAHFQALLHPREPAPQHAQPQTV